MLVLGWLEKLAYSALVARRACGGRYRPGDFLDSIPRLLVVSGAKYQYAFDAPWRFAASLHLVADTLACDLEGALDGRGVGL